MRRGLALVAAIVVVLTRAAMAQDFAASGSPEPETSPFSFLECGVPSSAGGVAAGACVVRRFAMTEIDTRAMALGASFRTLRLAAGLSQTGDDAIGWRSGGVGLGVAGGAFGAGVRGVARFDAGASPSRWRRGGVGVEAGGGGWATLGPTLRAWASAPAVWTGGAAAPLARGLTIGVRVGGEPLAAAISHEATPGHGGTLAVACRARLANVDVELRARERPVRAALRVVASVRSLRLAADVENHPVLAETVRLAVLVAPKEPR